MDEEQARAVSEVLGGVFWNSGGGVYLVRLEHADGHLVVISDEAVCEYDSEEAFEGNRPSRSILLH